jgi:serine/threonine protein kinase
VSHTDDSEPKPPPRRPDSATPEDAPEAGKRVSGPSPPQPHAPPRVPASSTTRTGAGTKRELQPDRGTTVRLTPEQVAAARAGATPDEPADSDATVKWSPEEVARLAEAEATAAAAAEAEEDPLVGTLIRNKWRVLKRLGAGSYGTVYKVRDVKGGWTEALKILGVDRLTGVEADEMRARFLREAQIMKRLGADSKHIVGLGTYEEDIEAGLIYFLMEFVEGKNLSDALHEGGPFSVDRTVRLAKQVCDALMAAHEGPEPVVHRDLKLENVMLAEDRSGEEIIKILDFGIAKIAEKDADSRLTTVGSLGTPGYAAPEQLRAEGVDGRTDLFAFGVILYALLTGRDPWLGNLAYEPTHQIYELMAATDRGAVKPLAETGATISPAMVAVIMKLLRRDPDQRYQSARELKEALERVESGAAEADSGSIRVLTPEPGVNVEVRLGREVVASGATPRVASGIPAGTYTVVVRDPLYSESETTVILGAGAIQDVTLVTSRRADKKERAKARPHRRRRRGLRVASLLVLALGAAAAWYTQPWGRTVDPTVLATLVDYGQVTDVWVTDGGVEGGVIVVPGTVLESVPMLADFRTPFFMPIGEGDIPELVRELRSRGVSVDASWEIRRLTDLAVRAQETSRYYGVAGGDVRSYALRLAELDPDNEEAASLLRKVAERMAWDADAALGEGPPGRAQELLEQCLALVPGYPRCVEVSERL